MKLGLPGFAKASRPVGQFRLPADIRARVVPADNPLQVIYLFLLSLDLRLLLFDCVDKHNTYAIVLDAFDTALRVMRNEHWRDARYILRSEPDVRSADLFPLEVYGT